MRWLGLSVLLLSCGKTEAPASPIVWLTDAEAAARTAAATQRRGIVFVGAEWDTGTKELQHTTFADPDVRTTAQGYVPLFIDASDSDAPDARSLLDRFKVLGTPTLIVLAPDFRTELFRASSFISPSRMASVLRYAGEESGPRDLFARTMFELHRHLIETVRERLLTHPLADPARLPASRSCWAEANPATAACLLAEDARMKQLTEEHERFEHEIVPDAVRGTPILAIRVHRSDASYRFVVAQAGPREPEQAPRARNVEVGIRLDARTTLGWGQYRTVHRASDDSTRGDRELHPGIEVLWQNAGDEVALVLLVDGFRRPGAWR